MEKQIKDFETKFEDLMEHFASGVQEFKKEMDAAMFQFVVKNNGKLGEERMERAIRKLKVAYQKCSYDMKQAKKIVVHRMNEIEGERRRKRRLEEDREINHIREQEEAELERQRSKVNEEIQNNELELSVDLENNKNKIRLFYQLCY